MQGLDAPDLASDFGQDYGVVRRYVVPAQYPGGHPLAYYPPAAGQHPAAHANGKSSDGGGGGRSFIGEFFTTTLAVIAGGWILHRYLEPLDAHASRGRGSAHASEVG